MTRRKIDRLTPEQKALIPAYCEKWRKIALLTEPINRQKAIDAVNLLYNLVGRDKPNILFIDSPIHHYAAAFRSEVLYLFRDNEKVLSKLERHLEPLLISTVIDSQKKNIAGQLTGELKFAIESTTMAKKRVGIVLEKIQQGKNRSEAFAEAYEELFSQEDQERIEILSFLRYSPLDLSQLNHSWLIHLYQQLNKEMQLPTELWVEIADLGGGTNVVANSKCIDIDLLTSVSAKFDYCISVLNFPDEPRWETIQALVKNCGSMIFPYEETCVVCDRPRILSFDNQQQLHAEGSPAIQFADGYSLFAYHGVILPETHQSSDLPLH